MDGCWPGFLESSKPDYVWSVYEPTVKESWIRKYEYSNNWLHYYTIRSLHHNTRFCLSSKVSSQNVTVILGVIVIIVVIVIAVVLLNSLSSKVSQQKYNTSNKSSNNSRSYNRSALTLHWAIVKIHRFFPAFRQVGNEASLKKMRRIVLTNLNHRGFKLVTAKMMWVVITNIYMDPRWDVHSYAELKATVFLFGPS